METDLNAHHKAAEHVTLIGSAIDLLLGIVKIVIGVFAHSSALIADGVHSISDLLTDIIVIVVLRLSHQAPDRDHPWGHGRFETVATVALGVVLIGVGAFMAYESIENLMAGTTELPTWPALVAAAISIGCKEWIFRYTLHVGEKLKSDLLIANAWHSRTDALSSVIVCVAVIGAMFGVIWLDAVAAVLVAIMVAKVGWDLISRSVTELVDTALPEEQIKALRETVLEIDGIVSVHSFKSRQMGSQSLLEMHLQVAPRISASEGHYLGDIAVERLKSRFDNLLYIIFHIDTYNDQRYPDDALTQMPSRAEIRQLLDEALFKQLGEDAHYELLLHYDPEYVDLELKMTLETSHHLHSRDIHTTDLKNHLQQYVKGKQDIIRNIDIWLSE